MFACPCCARCRPKQLPHAFHSGIDSDSPEGVMHQQRSVTDPMGHPSTASLVAAVPNIRCSTAA